MQFFVFSFNLQCTSGAHQIPKITIFMQFFKWFLISNAHQIPKTLIVVRDRKDPEVQQAIVLVVMVDMVNVVKRLSTILELQERYVAHSPRATECSPEDPVYVDAHAAHQIPKIIIFIQFFLYISLISNAHQIPKTFIFMQFFVYFLNFEC